MKTALGLASALLFSLPAAVRAAPPDLNAGAVSQDPLVPITTAQFARFLSGFQVSSIRLQGKDKALAGDAALKGLLSQVLAAVPAPAAAQRDPVDPDLPLAMQPDAGARGQKHLIFHDTHDETFNERWKKQAGLVRQALLRGGVPDDSIQIVALENREDFFCALSNAQGPRRVYFFGHGSPLVLHIGDEDVRVRDHIADFQQEQVQILTHYGCSFVNVSTGDLRGLQQGMAADTRITLVGHRLPSTPEDDRLFDRENPVVRLNVSPDRASMHFAQDEFSGRISAVGQLLTLPVSGPIPALAGAAASVHVSEQGRVPEKLPDPPSMLDIFFGRALGALRKPAPPPPPKDQSAPAPPQDGSIPAMLKRWLPKSMVPPGTAG